MALTSGRGGGLSLGGVAVSTLADWTINETSNTVLHSASNTAAAKMGLPGVRDWTGTANLYGNNALNASAAQIVPGSSYAFIGYNGATRDTGTVIVTAITVNCDIKGGGWLSGSIEFAGNGALTHASGAAVTDASAPKAYSSIGCKATWTPVVSGTVGSEADIPNVTGWSLKITADVKDIVVPSSAPWKTRLAGSAILSATATVNFADSDHVALTTAATRMTPGAYGILSLLVDSTNSWDLSQVLVDGVSGQGAKIETGDYEELTASYTWSAYSPISSTMTQGSITNPAGTAVYP